jgi:hypothetical protein
MSAAAAVAAQSGHDCCETEIAEIRLCAIQCGDGSKLPGQKQRLAFDMPPIAVSSTPQPLFTRIVAGGEWLRLQRDLVVDPPPALRFCRLLN